jgi:hypothetical protein
MGAIFKVPGYIVYFLGGLWGLFICLGIVKAKLGITGVIVGLFIFPVVVYVAPWWAGLVDGNWMPVMVVYGSGIVARILIRIGSSFDRK